MIKTNQNNDTTIIEILELHPNEMQLIHSMRNKWKYGEITIIVHDGIPRRIIRVTESINLN